MARCWECEAVTVDLMMVIVTSPEKIIGTLRLCQNCYERYCRPLVGQASEQEPPVRTLVVVGPHDHARRNDL